MAGLNAPKHRTKLSSGSSKTSERDDDSNKKNEVLTKSVIKIAEFLDLDRKTLVEIVGTSEATLSRIYNKASVIEVDSKEGELAVLLVRVYRSLYAILGSDREACRIWIHTHNKYFEDAPINSMKRITEFTNVVRYLDAMRGQY